MPVFRAISALSLLNSEIEISVQQFQKQMRYIDWRRWSVSDTLWLPSRYRQSGHFTLPL